MNVTSSTALTILSSGNSYSKDTLAGKTDILKSSNKSPLFKSDTSLESNWGIENDAMETGQKRKSDPKADAARQAVEAYLSTTKDPWYVRHTRLSAMREDDDPLRTEYNRLQDSQGRGFSEDGHNLFTPENKARMQELHRLLAFESMEQGLDFAITGKDPAGGSSPDDLLKDLRYLENEARSNGQDSSSITASMSKVAQMRSEAPARNTFFYIQNNERVAGLIGDIELGVYDEGTKSGYALMPENLRAKVEIWQREFSGDPKLHAIVESGRTQKLNAVERAVDDVLSGKDRIDTREKYYDGLIANFQKHLNKAQEKGEDISRWAEALKDIEERKKRDFANNPWDPQADNKKVEMFFNTVENGEFQAGINAGYSDMSDRLKAKLEIWNRDFRHNPNPPVDASQQTERDDNLYDFDNDVLTNLDFGVDLNKSAEENFSRLQNGFRNLSPEHSILAHYFEQLNH